MAADFVAWGVDVRILGEADAPSYFRLRLEGLTHDPRAFGRSADEYRAEGLERAARKLRPTPNSFTLGAFADGKLVGAATLVRHEMRKLRHKADVFAVYVAPHARGRGVGRALMTELIARAREMEGLEQLTLTVSATQDEARRLYAGVGFETFGVEPRALKIGDEYIDEEYMLRWL